MIKDYCPVTFFHLPLVIQLGLTRLITICAWRLSLYLCACLVPILLSNQHRDRAFGLLLLHLNLHAIFLHSG